jgi:RNA polymerase sigma factor (TIGR02999 family)
MNLELEDVTLWLQRLGAGSDGAARPDGGESPSERVFSLLYGELRKIARGQMRREAPEHTLSATALVHEAWFRLAEQTRTQWKSRGHFLAVASTMMRRILVNHAMARRARKRSAEKVPLALAEAGEVGAGPGTDVVAVHEALVAFEKVDVRAARIVELRFFGGLEIREIADVLATSPATVKRDWTLARAWLRRELLAAGAGDAR